MTEVNYQRAVARRDFLFKPFRPKSSQPLSTTNLLPDEDLLIMEKGERRYAFILRQMAYHHIAQGEVKGKPYLESF